MNTHGLVGPRVVPPAGPRPFELKWNGTNRGVYILQSSTDMRHWSNEVSVTLGAGTMDVPMGKMTNLQQFYRLVPK